ncbi:Alpha/Beta hydrolase protein [Suillus clintonianus]|uniref:Alpha/Beta hydrolase protein n=1 Tax=Suillus clintonianus TaxID=1904413 RepID=UPI001B873219|nr:Alpha/Beta hydrolase protein [Suillus clintonianus]KAG2112101.1 Alpha/Beta hydrolase protein [Suillus clintonianus]
MSISATQWGSPSASKRALLLHGLTMCSSSWEGLAQLLTAEGFFVVAPNLLGHAWRGGSDFRMSAYAKDLLPYFANDTSYDVIMGHSLGGPVALELLPFLPTKKETTIILVDPALDFNETQADTAIQYLSQETTTVRTAEEHMAENHAWSRNDSMLRVLGAGMCNRTVVEQTVQQNMPWCFGGLFKNIPANVKITILISDPKEVSSCDLEKLPRDVEGIKIRIFANTGIGHWMQYECPEIIMEEVPLEGKPARTLEDQRQKASRSQQKMMAHM